MPRAERLSAGWCSITPPRTRRPLGQPPTQLKKSPLTPIIVICDATRRSIDDTVSRPVIVSFDSNGVTLYKPPGFGAVTTYACTGPLSTRWSYVTPGMICDGRASAAGARTSPRKTTASSLPGLTPPPPPSLRPHHHHPSRTPPALPLPPPLLPPP